MINLHRTTINAENSTHSVHSFINENTHQHAQGDAEMELEVARDMRCLHLQSNVRGQNGGGGEMGRDLRSSCSRNSKDRKSRLKGTRDNNRQRTTKIKVQPCNKLDSNQQTPIKQCRICLEGEEQGRMVQPCQCSGSVTYAHEKCIIEWIRRKHDPKLPTSIKTKLQCEMCNTPFVYKWSKNRKLDLTQFCKNYEKQKCNFIMFYIFVIVILLVIVGLIVVISEGTQNSQLGIKIRSVMLKTENIKIIYICVVFILIIVFMFLLILFIIEYAVRSELVIGQVFNYTQGPGRKQKRIHPKVSCTVLPVQEQLTPQYNVNVNENQSNSTNRQPVVQVNSTVPASSNRPEQNGIEGN